MSESKDKGFIFILGTRPEAIKLAPVILECEKRDLQYTVVTTGQHPTLCVEALREFGISPHYELSNSLDGKGLDFLSSGILLNLSRVELDWENAITVVQGDTTSALMGAYFAFLKGSSVAHVEAGLRTNQADRPFPEEMNRRVISRLAKIHFASTQRNMDSLIAENVSSKDILVVGNTVIDAVKYFRISAKKPNEVVRVLVTLHRRENHGFVIKANTDILGEIALKHPKGVKFTFIKHPNPLAWQSVSPEFISMNNVEIIDPLNYRDLITLLSATDVIVTDSGGLQEEATYLGIPTLIVRTETERIEAVESGVCSLVGVEGDNLRTQLEYLLRNISSESFSTPQSNVFGDGSSAKLIVDALLH